MNNREIDRLVAEKVMGWTLKEMTATSAWMDSQGGWTLYQMWKPSTDMRDAWLVAEKLYITVCPQQGAPTEMSVWAEINKQPLGNCYEAFAKTAPMAICLVALKAAGVEIES
ncbi:MULTISPECIES: BC1872 family protein [Bacillaceae]|uniref:BC1872 family protein n=1 Tax=Pseudobacillus TaxID=108525 RepID=UPI0005971126|nr:hypothetical protein [Bacillus badius]MED4718257.1 hypothetical protein [Bacillus badius]